MLASRWARPLPDCATIAHATGDIQSGQRRRHRPSLRPPLAPVKYHLFTALLLVAALPLYLVGFALGGTFVLGVAVVLEAWFWIRVVRGKPRVNAAGDTQ